MDRQACVWCAQKEESGRGAKADNDEYKEKKLGGTRAEDVEKEKSL